MNFITIAADFFVGHTTDMMPLLSLIIEIILLQIFNMIWNVAY